MTSFVSHFFHMFSHLKFSRFLTFCLTYLHHWRSLTEAPKDQVVEHTGSPEVTGNHHSDSWKTTVTAISMIRWLRNPPVDRWFISLFIGFQHVSTILLVVQDFAISISSGIGGTVSVIFSHHFFFGIGAGGRSVSWRTPQWCGWFEESQLCYHLVMTNSSPWKDPPIFNG